MFATTLHQCPADCWFPRRYEVCRGLVNRACSLRGPGKSCFVFLEEADRVVATSKEANFFLLVLSQTCFMLLYEMGSYPLGTGPHGAAEGTLSLPLMFVSNMPLQVLRSSIHFPAICAVMRPSENLDTILRVPCTSQVRILLSLFKS